MRYLPTSSWLPFLLCLLLSAGIWLTHKLSLTYVETVSVPLVIESNLEGRAARSSNAVDISARVHDSGYKLIWLSRRRPVSVFVRSEDLIAKGGGVFCISAQDLLKYGSGIFGNSAQVQNFSEREYNFSFQEEYSKKVPVKPVRDLAFQPQYMLKEFVVEPDSVIVFGEPQRVDETDAVYTRPVFHTNLRKPIDGKVRLEQIPGIRLSEESVHYKIEVTRFVELDATLPVHTRNVPEDSSLEIYPSSASLNLKCTFPMSSSPLESAYLYVDYEDFLSSHGGMCVIRCDSLPRSVTEYRIDPPICECIETRQEKK
ncbi:MAG: hypothetical protein J5764_01210 [Bacteroidales bacterium]|nr:hypothetical protein [Bacteroidales bacterium]